MSGKAGAFHMQNIRTDPRMALLCFSLAAAVLLMLSRALAGSMSAAETAAAMAGCVACALFRGASGRCRREAMEARARTAGTPMERTACGASAMRAAAAYGLLDSAWLSVDACTCLAQGPLGALAVLFQALFLAGFPYARSVRPDIFDGREASDAADMMESLLIAQACAAVAAYAWISGKLSAG